MPDITLLIEDGRVLTAMFGVLLWWVVAPPLIKFFLPSWFDRLPSWAKGIVSIFTPTLIPYFQRFWETVTIEIDELVDMTDNTIDDEIWGVIRDRFHQDLDGLVEWVNITFADNE